MNNQLKQALLELVRTALLAVIPLVIIQLQTGKLNPEYLVVAGAISLLKGMDELLSQLGTGINGKGITGM